MRKLIITICLLFTCSLQAACTSDGNNPTVIKTIKIFQGQSFTFDINGIYNYEYPDGWKPDFNGLSVSDTALSVRWNGETILVNLSDPNWRDCYGQPKNPDPNIGVSARRQFLATSSLLTPPKIYRIKAAMGFKEIVTIDPNYTSKIAIDVNVLPLKLFSPF